MLHIHLYLRVVLSERQTDGRWEHFKRNFFRKWAAADRIDLSLFLYLKIFRFALGFARY
jgi:hypothetical protein